MMNGVFLFLMFTFYVYAYSIASVMMEKNIINVSTGKAFTIGDIIAVSQGAIMAMMTLGGIIPILPTIIRARICARKVFDVIERKPLIDTNPGS
jgi:ABC-type multidrug transport system fused ATPase/permease subunit